MSEKYFGKYRGLVLNNIDPNPNAAELLCYFVLHQGHDLIAGLFAAGHQCLNNFFGIFTAKFARLHELLYKLLCFCLRVFSKCHARLDEITNRVFVHV